MSKIDSNKSDETQIIASKDGGKFAGKLSLFKKNEIASTSGDTNIKLYDDSEFSVSLRRVQTYADQILGTRKNQEDSFAVSGSSDDIFNEIPKAWGVVCDGMGGLDAGEIASGTAVNIMKQVLSNTYAEDDIPKVLKQAVFIANDEVKKLGSNTGTTLVCAVANGSSFYYITVGDSRIYLCRGNEIKQINRDHNYYLELLSKVSDGKISLDEANSDPKREALISYIGIENLELYDANTSPIRLESGDVIFLCSDGVTKVLTDNEILYIINSYKHNLKQLTDTVLSQVQGAPMRSLDNTTVAVLKYEEL